MAAAEEASELLPLVHLGILGRGATAVPPAMTRRILELVTHLAKHTAKAAFDLIRLDIRPAEAQAAILLGAQVTAALADASMVIDHDNLHVQKCHDSDTGTGQ